MEKEVAFKWADELDSGNHQQGKGYLEFTDPHGVVKQCCLGVAARMCNIDESRTGFSNGYMSDTEFQTVTFDGRDRLLSPHLVAELGLSTAQGEFTNLRDRESLRVALTELNDAGFTFPQIADLIRFFYKEL